MDNNHLRVLNGLRGFTCLAIVYLHVMFFFGQLIYQFDVPCYVAMDNVPILGFLSVPSFHMSTFWLISGFLCQLQLDRLGERFASSGKVPLLEYVKFLANRWLRVLPIYVIVVLLFYSNQYQRRHETEGLKHRCLEPLNVVRSLTFQGDFLEGDISCSQHGWSLQNDINGYGVLALLQFVLAQTSLAPARSSTVQQALIWAWCVISWIHLYSRKVLDWQQLSPEALEYRQQNARVGIEILEAMEFKVYDWFNLDLPNLYEPSSYNQELRESYKYRAFHAYWSGLFGHGCAVLLGSALYLSLKANHWQGRYLTIKCLAAAAFWVGTDCTFVFSGLPLYFWMEALLSKSSPLHLLRPLLANRLWDSMTPYVYGIYMMHFLVLGVRQRKALVTKITGIRNGGDPCVDFDYTFVFRETAWATFVSLVLAVVFYNTWERPWRSLRQRYFSVSRVEKVKSA